MSWRSEIEFPAAAFSPVGWWRGASNSNDLCDASPDDTLGDWQGLEIYDSAGRKFTARQVFIEWPHTRLGRWLCGLVGNAIHVGFDLYPPERVSVEELFRRLSAVENVPRSLMGATHRKILQHVCR